MQIQFEKYQGTGNDFIMIDNRHGEIDAYSLPITAMCDRKFGIGADGVIVIELHDSVDFNMIYFNPDGSQSFCGNGSRCAVAFARSLDLINGETIFLSTDGLHEAIISNNTVALKMHDVSDIKTHGKAFELNTGSPHYIQFVDDVSTIEVVEEARKIRYNDTYKDAGINVNFVEREQNALKIRTYERGVENETLSCGTGVTAAVLAEAFNTNKTGEKMSTDVKVEGGELKVEFTANPDGFADIYLIGPAQKTFEGRIEI